MIPHVPVHPIPSFFHDPVLMSSSLIPLSLFSISVFTLLPLASSTPTLFAYKQRPPSSSPQEQKAADMRKAWAVITAATYALLPWCKEGPAAVSTTVLSLLHANALPASVKKARTVPYRTIPYQTEPDRTGPSRTGPGRTGPRRAAPRRPVQLVVRAFMFSHGDVTVFFLVPAERSV